MTDSIPFFSLQQQYSQLRHEIDSAIQSVLTQQRFILGPDVEKFEEEIAEYHRCAYAVGVSSGSDALLLAMLSLGIEPGDEVITTSYSFFSTAGSIARLGAVPVFVDIDPMTFNMRLDSIEHAITERTKAIVVVHLFGLMVDINQITSLAKQYKLHVIEDAAQAIGARFGDVYPGNESDVACLSFFPTKNLGGYGDSGMILTNNPHLAETARMLRNHGFPPNEKYNSKKLGGNFRLDTIQAAVLRVKLRYLATWTEQRIRNAKLYLERIKNYSGGKVHKADDTWSEIGNNRVIAIDYSSMSVRHVYNQFVIWTPIREELIESLHQQRIGYAIYYPRPLHHQPSLLSLCRLSGSCKVAELAAQQTLALPIYPEVSTEQIDRVCDALFA